MPRDTEPQGHFLSEEISAERREMRRQLLRLAIAFALLFAAVFFAFWWSGSAVRFGAARVTDTSVPTWTVTGTVRNAHTREPIPWARIEDDTGWHGPHHRTEADQHGAYTLLTLAEPHPVRITAIGYRPARIDVGRQWFLWMPEGSERRDVELTPE
jgi:hypothetical protein